ncbi:DUF4136 domain-containing protein [Robertkochia flava]|uniref:DUF4136 domain-containing protein n=1 Tax=Robertkochia flava TaxID=3447986 RepID=UPI001CC9ED7A|nr:DUF4136 domain-containing protein [Robertkochia marina]
MKQLLCLVVFFLLSCSSVKVSYDYDQKEDYSKYQVYDFFSPMNTMLGELDSRRAIRAVDQILREKGFTKVQEGETPQFYVNIKSEMFQEVPSSSIGIGMGGTGADVSGGVSMGFPVGDPTLKRVIYLDMVNVKQDALFWQARCEVSYKESISPGQRDAEMYKIMEKALSAFPPEKK